MLRVGSWWRRIAESVRERARETRGVVGYGTEDQRSRQTMSSAGRAFNVELQYGFETQTNKSWEVEI